MKKIIAVLSAVSLAAALCVNSFAANLGDVNGDDSVNSADALMVLQYSVGENNKEFIKANADINGDGNINSSDALSILQISVGAYVPSFAADTLATYNKALQKSYDNVKKAVITTDFTCDYTLNGATGAVKSSPHTDELEFVNGLFNGELPASACGPKTELTEAMLQSASVSKNGNGYKIRLVLKAEKVDVKKSPVYNTAGGMTIDFSAVDTPISDYDSGYTNYTGTIIEAITDSSGRVTSLKITTPYEADYKLKVNGARENVTEKGTSTYSVSFSF